MAKLFSLPKNKRFSYAPRFYDERAAQRNERNERIRKELDAEKEGRTARISKDELANYIKMTRRTQKKSNLRLLVILALLLAIFYVFFLK